MSVELISPFPPEDYHLLWAWLNEFPRANFHDPIPKSLTEARAGMRILLGIGVKLFEVLYEGKPVGLIGYLQRTSRIGAFQGICFTKSLHGKGVAIEAVSEVLRRAFHGGTAVVEARYFADNTRVERFLAKLGAKETDHFLDGTTRYGKMVDWKTIEITASDFSRAQELLLKRKALVQV